MQHQHSSAASRQSKKTPSASSKEASKALLDFEPSRNTALLIVGMEPARRSNAASTHGSHASPMVIDSRGADDDDDDDDEVDDDEVDDHDDDDDDDDEVDDEVDDEESDQDDEQVRPPALPSRAFPKPEPSSLLSRVANFLPQLHQANAKLDQDIAKLGRSAFDIENVDEEEEEQHIEMNLTLGIVEESRELAPETLVIDPNDVAQLRAESAAKPTIEEL